MSANKNTITLKLDGDVGLNEFAEAIFGLKSLIESIQKNVDNGVSVTWDVDQLEVSSAVATFRAKTTPRNRGAVNSIVRRYEEVGEACATRKPMNQPPEIINSARRILGVINGRINSVVFETEESDFEITEKPQRRGALFPGMEGNLEVASMKPSVGSVVGRIQSLSNRGGLRFTIYESNNDKAVSCYLKPGREEELRQGWGKLAAVEGIVCRSKKSGRPLSVREVSKILIIEEAKFDWRKAIGASPFLSGDEKPEVVIRKIRNAW